MLQLLIWFQMLPLGTLDDFSDPKSFVPMNENLLQPSAFLCFYVVDEFSF